MKDANVTMEEMMSELEDLRRQVVELKVVQAEYERVEEELFRQSRLFKGVARAKHCLLTVSDHNHALNKMLEVLGETGGVDRVYIFERHPHPETGEIVVSRCFEWASDMVSPQIDNPKLQNLSYSKLLHETICNGKPLCALVSEMPEPDRSILADQGILSILIVPIYSQGKLWGFIGFDDCQKEYVWSDNEISILITMAASIGAVLEHKYTEEILRENERKFRMLIENVSDIITVADRNGVILYTSPSVQRISGFSTEELIGRNLFQLIHSHDIQLTKDTLNSLLKTYGSSRNINLRMIDSKGECVYLEAIVSNLLNEPSVEGIIINCRDVTTRKLAERALAEEKERLAVTLRSIGEGVITTDMEGRIVLMNKAAEELIGWTQEEARKRPLKDVFVIIDKKTRKLYEDPLRKVLRSRGAGGLTRTMLIDRNGKEHIISDTGAHIRDRSNRIMGTVLVFRDITDKIRIEEEMIKSNKIESIGVLAGGIAHDFNNILTTILGNSSLAVMYIKNGNKEKVLDRLLDIEKASLQARDLTQQLLTFARGGEPVVKTVSIAGLLKDTVGFILSGSNVCCEFLIPDNLWNIEVDEGQISQVINNLVINAKQAMPEGGMLKIKAHNVSEISDPRPPLKSGRYIKISIEDTGLGIPEENLSRIFDPYFTTKPKGTGLGLATAYSIIKKHNGYIDVKSKPGEGTNFSIYLPGSNNKLLENKKVQSSETHDGNILIMDDEKAVREVVGMMLNHLGYNVSYAGGGSEALELYIKAMESGWTFDAVIMDLTIPGGMGGRDAVKKFLEIDPDVKAIVSSGYSNDTVMADYKEYGFKAIIAKPYSIEELSRVLHNVISEKKIVR